MSKIAEFTDTLPGGEKRRAAREEIVQAKIATKGAKYAENSARMTNHPYRTRLIWGGAGALAIGTLYFLNQTGGDKAVGEAAGKTVNVGVEAGAGAASSGVNIAKGAVEGGKEAVDNVTSESDISLQWPVTNDNEQVSNTTPNTSNTTNPSGETQVTPDSGSLVVLTSSVTITDVPLGEDGTKNYSAAGVVATPIQVAKACFSAGEIEMTSTDWADVYENNILTVDSNFQQGGAFFQEQQPVLNPRDVVNCQ